MRITVISPESEDPREVRTLELLLAAGLPDYHVRKPGWDEGRTEAWLRRLPVDWRPRLILHGHAGLAARLGLGGCHAQDAGDEASNSAAARSCHDLAGLRRRLGRYRTLFFGPVFPSLTKAGYAPAPDFPWAELQAVLTGRPGAGRTRVYAIGGITAAGLPRCRALGFDGVAVLGAVWTSADPAGAFSALRDAADALGDIRHAA
jgi:thiamine-phosphate pyrophosphorylase